MKLTKFVDKFNNLNDQEFIKLKVSKKGNVKIYINGKHRGTIHMHNITNISRKEQTGIRMLILRILWEVL